MKLLTPVKQQTFKRKGYTESDTDQLCLIMGRVKVMRANSMDRTESTYRSPRL